MPLPGPFTEVRVRPWLCQTASPPPPHLSAHPTLHEQSIKTWLEELVRTRTSSINGILHFDMGPLKDQLVPLVSTAYTGLMAILGNLISIQASE